ENIPNATAEKVKISMLEGVEIALGLSKGSLQSSEAIVYQAATVVRIILLLSSTILPIINDNIQDTVNRFFLNDS
ncbi:hypothetical protein Dimus_024804, partial [Dionaea muscipula]